MVSSIADIDKSNENTLHRIDVMLQTLSKSKDRVCNMVFESWRKVLGNKKQFTGLKLNYLDVACGGNDYMRLCYNRYGIAFSGDGTIKKEDLAKAAEKGRGFIDIYSMLDDLCVDITKKLVNEGKRDMVGIALTMNADTIPSGEFRRTYLKDNGGSSDIEGFFNYISDIIGYRV